ncbi:regulator of cell cycle RGCC [Microcaecilia unicolor]|uniref:Regulator of cell cycle RGCC-like n=1 Tax=Microcaecilia unicolor TaxID=1415580 RepID=A0A6P7YS55_9AMPH|nr:regulator of cell cycle RGCC-like [Microcaecilia unicolor]
MASETTENAAAFANDLLEDILREFDETIQDFEQGPCCQYEEHLEQLKRRNIPSICDSGIDELESASTSPGSSLNTSEENLNTSVTFSIPRAKLGDTQELENFIMDLDKVLEEM